MLRFTFRNPVKTPTVHAESAIEYVIHGDMATTGKMVVARVGVSPSGEYSNTR
jgi:hypothetical protein